MTPYHSPIDEKTPLNGSRIFDRFEVDRAESEITVKKLSRFARVFSNGALRLFHSETSKSSQARQTPPFLESFSCKRRWSFMENRTRPVFPRFFQIANERTNRSLGAPARGGINGSDRTDRRKSPEHCGALKPCRLAAKMPDSLAGVLGELRLRVEKAAMARRRNMVVAQSGGPSPVINNSLRGIIETAAKCPKSAQSTGRGTALKAC